ncbi:hypothetical protein FBU30_003348 [Linnemannia zychae]|nr:hypothetical protein FBU30_003348 [Linnemannia zychae]
MSFKSRSSLPEIDQSHFVAFASLAALTVIPIFFGSLASLNKWKNPENKAKKYKHQIDSDDEEQDAPSESLSADSAFTFPILGSLIVLGLHYALREFNSIYVDKVLTTFFSINGLFATSLVGVNVFTAIMRLLGVKLDTWHIDLTRPSKEFYTAKFTLIHLVMLIASVMLAGYYAITKNWIASNIVAFSLAMSAIEIFSLESFNAGIILLSGFCIADAYWRYKSPEILNAVLIHIDIPNKITIPRLLFGWPFGEVLNFSSLGLGEIIAPGVFVALCLRYDQYRAGIKNPSLGHSIGFRRPYFTACLTAYVLGLGVYLYVSHTISNTHPMILYLSVACVFSVFLSATVRGESKQVFGYISEAGLANAKARKAALDKKKRLKAQKQLVAARRTIAPRSVSRLPNVIKEESFVARSSSSSSVSVSEDSTPASPAL